MTLLIDLTKALQSITKLKETVETEDAYDFLGNLELRLKEMSVKYAPVQPGATKIAPYPWTEEEKAALTNGTPLLAFPGNRPRCFVVFLETVPCNDGVNPTCAGVAYADGTGAAYAWRAVAPIHVLERLPIEVPPLEELLTS